MSKKNKLLIIPIQSISDVITNSSSEIFVLDTDKSISEVIEILEAITTGFQEPIKFNLKEFEETDFEEVEECDYFRYYDNTYYDVVRNNFVDLNDERSVYRDKLYRIYYYDGYEELQRLIDEELDKITKESRNWYFYDVYTNPSCLKIAIDVIKKYEAEHGSVKPVNDSIQSLDGKVLVLSESDNTIPYETFDVIDYVLNGKHYHLG